MVGTIPNYLADQEVRPGRTNVYQIFVPGNATALRIRVKPNPNSPTPFPPMSIYARAGQVSLGPADLRGINDVIIRNPAGDQTWTYGISHTQVQPVRFDLQTVTTVVIPSGNYTALLSALNNALGPYYRYDSGTSMAAPIIVTIAARAWRRPRCPACWL
ncbi:MAG: hypothetical protein DME26_18605 [Verrucomicrobia bacterium]|nr:MAG: hypothetical protein DME26_18605 [Verrucomicrobiota bacterium]